MGENEALLYEDKVETKTWWVSCPTDKDEYHIYVAKYCSQTRDGKTILIEASYLSGNWWKSYDEGQIIEPALILPGALVNTLYNHGVLYRGDVSDSIKELVERIFNAQRESTERPTETELPEPRS